MTDSTAAARDDRNRSTAATTVNFHDLITTAGSEAGARELFERLVQQLASVQQPGVRGIASNPGDWGIDAYIGTLGDGEVSVWQAKYYIRGVGASQQNDIRNSLKSMMNAAKEKGFRPVSWTLCIPVSLDGPTTQWWERWKSRMSVEHSIVIELWDEVQLRRYLLSEEAAHLRRLFFTSEEPRQEDVHELDDGSQYSESLFVRQLRETGAPEIDAAMEAFFNAEILTQTIHDRALQNQVSALKALSSGLRATWEVHFNRHATNNDEQVRVFPNLIWDVMQAAEAQPVSDIRTAAVHHHGIVHQHVNNAKAGWVRDWRAVAQSHPTLVSASEPNQRPAADVTLSSEPADTPSSGAATDEGGSA